MFLTYGWGSRLCVAPLKVKSACVRGTPVRVVEEEGECEGCRDDIARLGDKLGFQNIYRDMTHDGLRTPSFHTHQYS